LRPLRGPMDSVPGRNGFALAAISLSPLVGNCHPHSS
jgi:hypothetical protein